MKLYALLFMLFSKVVQMTFTRFNLEKWPRFVVTFYSHWYLLLINSFICTGSLLIAIVTAERYFLVCHPLKFRFLHSKQATYIALVTIVIISFIIHIPHAIDRYVAQHVSAITNTTYYTREWNMVVRRNIVYKYVWPYIRQTFYSFLPMLCLIIFNPLIIRAYRRTARQRRKMKANQTKEEAINSKDERRILILLLSISLVFLVCMTPQAVLGILMSSLPVSLINTVGFFTFRIVAHLLEKVNFAANYYAYSLASREFRKSFMEVFPVFFKNKVGPGLELT